ncbi:MAG: homoserine kinase [Candidatus Accumulibacter sp.]|nr:homoserine kinase [Accumulibacter sp.]
MSVFTGLSATEVGHWLENYSLGALRTLTGIAEGVQNSNFLLDTTHGEYVLTVFEQLPVEELPFFLELLAHLASRGIPCPQPIANRHGSLLSRLQGKPAAIVSRLRGHSVITPTLVHCAAIGGLLARLHRAAADFPTPLAHVRDTAWCVSVAERLIDHLPPTDADLLDQEIAYQQRHRPSDLPRGVIHADLFRDNVLFEGWQLSGVLDFYFAGVEDLLFDLAVAVNDWCIESTGRLDAARCLALLGAYHDERPLLSAERAAWPTLLRAAALRFWLSRLQDHYRPRHGELVVRRDPEVYRRLLQSHITSAEHGDLYLGTWVDDRCWPTSDDSPTACAIR